MKGALIRGLLLLPAIVGVAYITDAIQPPATLASAEATHTLAAADQCTEDEGVLFVGCGGFF